MIVWCGRMSNRIGNSNYFGKHDPIGNRELKYYKDIHGNDVRLFTTQEKNIIDKVLIISSVFIVILLGGFFYKFYLVQKEVEERTQFFLKTGDSITDGKDIVNAGGIIVSEDEEIVDVEDDGTLVAKNSGTTNVTIYKNIDTSDFSKVVNSAKSVSNIHDIYNSLGVEGEYTFSVTVQQNVTGVSLISSTINLNVGETSKIIANVYPYNAYNKEVVWQSDNPSVVVVDSKGVVSTRNAGAAVITATTKDGGFKDSILVNVARMESRNNIYLSLDSNEFYVGEKKNLMVVVSPKEELESKIAYSSSDSSVATINSNGQIVAKKKGKATITARIASEGISSSIEILVKEKEIEEVYLSSTNLTLGIADTYNLKAYYYPGDGMDHLVYTSSNSQIVSVDSNGVMTALREGEAIITVKNSNNISAKCSVEVKKDFIKATGTNLSLSNNSVDVGEEVVLVSSVEPANAYDKYVTYVSSDSSIARVLDNGRILAIKSGSVVITATNSAGISETVTLKVNDTLVPVEEIKTSSMLILEAGQSKKIDIDISPSNATDLDIVWVSDNENVAKVNSFGVVTGISGGSAVISAIVGDASSSTIVRVNDIKAKNILLNYAEINVFSGDEVKLKGTILPANTTELGITWISNDENIAYVDENGKVTAVNEGKTIIKAISKSDPSVFSECVVNVSKVVVESYKLSHKKIVLTEGESVYLGVLDIKPQNAVYDDIVYTITDDSVATVSKGLVTGMKAGDATIIIDVDGLVKTIDVTVLDSGNKVYFIDTYSDLGGSSDAILLESNGKYAMIDTGSNFAAYDTVKFLKDLGVEKLEFILITHFHSENFGGIYGLNSTNNILLSGIKVDKIYMRPYSASDSNFLDVDRNLLVNREKVLARRNTRKDIFISLKENIVDRGVSYISLNSKTDVLRLEDFKLNLYNLEDQLKMYASKCLDSYTCSENSNSIVTYASVNSISLYFASDIYNACHSEDTKYLKIKTEEEVAKNITKDHGNNIDIYKAANYGYSYSNVSGALKQLNPKYSIITNSEKSLIADSKGIERIQKYTSNNLYYTGNGTVIVNIDENGNISFSQLRR